MKKENMSYIRGMRLRQGGLGKGAPRRSLHHAEEAEQDRMQREKVIAGLSAKLASEGTKTLWHHGSAALGGGERAGTGGGGIGIREETH
jgi:hypothetical protein